MNPSPLQMLWKSLGRKPRERILQDTIKTAQYGNLPIVGATSPLSEIQQSRREFLKRAGANASASAIPGMEGGVGRVLLKDLLRNPQPRGGLADTLEDAAYVIVGDEGKRALWEAPIPADVIPKIDIDLARGLITGVQKSHTENIAKELRSALKNSADYDYVLDDAVQAAGFVDPSNGRYRIPKVVTLDQLYNDWGFGAEHPFDNLADELPWVSDYLDSLRGYNEFLYNHHPKLFERHEKLFDER